MRRFTRLLTLLFMLCIVGVANAKVEQVHATFASPTNTGTSWDAATKTFKWNATSYNQLRDIGLPSGDLTKYKKLVVDLSFVTGNRIRVLLYKGGANKTLYAQEGKNEFILADTLKALYPDDYNEFLRECTEVCISGDNAIAPGEVVVNDVYFETYDDEGEKTYATFASPTNTGTSWDAATKTFKWNATSYNQLRNIGLPSGDITKYKKLVVDLSFVTGNRIRVLIYKGGANKTLYAQEGVNEFILADTLKALYPDDYNEFLRECTEVCISGDNAIAPGEVVVNSVYLETYPENETVDIPDVVVEEDPGRPAGDFVDLTQELFSGNATLDLGKKLGKGEMVYGAKSIDAFADLSDYSKLTIVATPGMMFNINLNHQVEFKNSDADYGEEDLGKFDWVNAQTGEDGIYELDLTQFENRNLNCIWTPWAYEKMGTVWYLLLTKGETAPVAQNVTFDFNASNHATSNDGNAGDITENEVNTVGGVVMTITPAAEGANTPNRYWSTNNVPQLRMYSGKLTLEAPEGKAITKVEIEKGSKWGENNTFNGEAAAEATWEGNSTNVVLAIAANSQMNKVVVTLADKNEETTTYEEAVEPEEPVIDPADLAQIAKKAEMTGELKSIADLEANKFMLQNENGLVIYTPDGWDIKVADLLKATANTGNGGFFALTPLDGDHAGQYQVPIYNLDGTRRTFWAGEQYLNSQPQGGNVIFGLGGTAPQYGQDGQNLALWTITYEEGKGFAFHCVGRDIYLGNDAEAARPVEAITYWKAYAGYKAGYDEAEILAACKSVSTVLKTKDDVAALEDAKTAYAEDKNLDKFGDAVNAAIAAYKACDALNQANANLDATGAPVAAEVLAKYEAGEYANVAELTAAYVAAVKTQSTAGANMTLAIVNPSFETGNIDGWTNQDGGGAANNGNFGAATGKYFVEKWTNSANGGKLSDGSLLQTITDMPNGKYIVKAEMQNREQGNGDAAGKGYFLVANDGKTEAVVNNGQTIEAAGVVTDGTLTIGAKIEGCSGNWVCVDNFQLFYCGEVASEAELADLAAEVAIAKSLNVDVTAYENGVFTSAEVAAAIEALKVAEYAQVNKDYTINAAVLVPDFAQWEGEMVSNKGQHWDGTGTSLYYEQTGAQWGQSAWTNNKKTTVTLPKGKYVLYAAGRASAGTACSAYLKVNDVTRSYTSKGDVGFGVATDGTASFDPAATYANGNKGRGFEYRYVAFEVTADDGEEISLEVGGEATAEHQWMSFTAPVLLTTEDNVAIMIPVLSGKITAAKADLESIKGTVGDGLFMKPQAAYDEYAAAVADAEPFIAEGATPTAEEIKAALAAIDAKAEAFANAPVIAPDAAKSYSFQLRLDGETPLYMTLAEGGISISEEATLLKFVETETAGQYNLVSEDNTLFVGLAGGNAWTMSTAADKKAAWTFTALPDGAYRINNLVTAGRFVGTNAAEKASGAPCYADKQVSNGNVDWIITAIIPEVAHTWNFTKWSAETVANLKAEAAKVTVEPDPDKEGNTMCTDNGALWSDHEKKPGTTCDTYAASKDNCFWAITTPDENGEVAANGVAIAELKGLSFNSTYSASRALAIAVNYPTTSLGTYNGPAYLWFGGKNQEILTIKNVKAGTAITIGIESHKPAEARGVQLLVAGEELKDAEGNAVAAPTTYVEQTWAVPAGEGVVDVVVKNTNGCHIYFIDAEIGEPAPEVNPDDDELVAPEGWVSEITNGNLAGDEVANYISKEYPAADPYASTITPGAGKNNSRGILVKSQDKVSQPWDSQFWINLNETLPAGTKVHVEFDYKADIAGSVGTQAHGAPGAYLHWAAIGNVEFAEEWKHFTAEFDVASEADNMQSIAFNLNDIEAGNTFYFDNFGVWVQKPAPVEKWVDIVINGNMEENDPFYFKTKIYPETAVSDAAFTAGAGKDGGQGLKIESPAKVDQDWDTQFWIALPIALEQGKKFKLEFDYKADAAVTSSAQYHAAPSDYIGNWVDVNFTTEWQHFEKEGIAPAANSAGNKFQSIAFNLTFDNATTLYFDNVKLFLDEETAATGIKSVNTEIPFIEGAVYDLQGRRVAKPARGLYIINGKKVMVK